MIHLKLLLQRSLNLRKLLPMTLCILLLITSPLTTFAQGQRVSTLLQPQSKPCADSDQSERCVLKRAVSAALDQIAKLQEDLKRAEEAIEAQEKTISDAKVVLEGVAKEREATDKTIAASQKVIEQQQKLVETYERAIGTLQQMVQMALNRIDTLERKVDKANGRTAVLGAILTIVGVGATIFIRR